MKVIKKCDACAIWAAEPFVWFMILLETKLLFFVCWLVSNDLCQTNNISDVENYMQNSHMMLCRGLLYSFFILSNNLSWLSFIIEKVRNNQASENVEGVDIVFMKV